MRKLLLLRHGRTRSNENKTFTGQLDVPLSPEGREALLLRKETGIYPKATFFFTSGMLRARETLRLLYGEVPSVEIPELAEYHFGLFAGRTHADLFASEPLYRRWLRREEEALTLPGGESRLAFAQRVEAGFARVAATPWTGLAVLISHGGVMRALVGIAESEPCDNGGGYLLTLTKEGAIAGREVFRK